MTTDPQTPVSELEGKREDGEGNREGAIIICPNCGTVYLLGWEHACDEDGKLYVRRPR